MKEHGRISLDHNELRKPGLPGMRWLVLWIAAAATTIDGVLFLCLGPNVPLIGKGFVPGPVLGQVSLGLIAIGSLGILVGTAGIAGSCWRVSITATDDQSSVRRTSGVKVIGRADAVAYDTPAFLPQIPRRL